MRPVVMMANRNGFFYTLDRGSGELLVGVPFTGTQWARELDPDGRPIVLNDGLILPGETEPRGACVPDLRGGTNFNPPSYDPERGLFFVMARESCAFYQQRLDEVPDRQLFMSGTMRQQPEPSYSMLRALDPRTGELQWETLIGDLNQTGVTSTASGVVFAGNIEGDFAAFDSATGELAMELLHGLSHPWDRGDDLHARRPAVRPDSIGFNTDGICVEFGDGGVTPSGVTPPSHESVSRRQFRAIFFAGLLERGPRRVGADLL